MKVFIAVLIVLCLSILTESMFMEEVQQDSKYMFVVIQQFVPRIENIEKIGCLD